MNGVTTYLHTYYVDYHDSLGGFQLIDSSIVNRNYNEIGKTLIDSFYVDVESKGEIEEHYFESALYIDTHIYLLGNSTNGYTSSSNVDNWSIHIYFKSLIK